MLSAQPIAQDLIVQHHLTDDECKKIVEILGCSKNRIQREREQ